jgi:hypothetical protein
MVSGADRFICRVSHSGDRPILFLPPRDRIAGLPEGWVEITADGEDYQAKFVKVAVNVMQRPDNEENVLPELMRRWFGEAAGQPGTSQFVEFSRSGGRYVLAPHQGEAMEGPRLWASYARADVPKLFGFEFGGFESQLGVVERDKLTLLFVTLDKSQKPEEHRYDDAFLSPEEFRWQSQNRTSRESEAGRRISEHAKRGIGVHLFVRAQAKSRGVTQRFTYCGPLEFERWEGDRPITAWWHLQTKLPENLWTTFRTDRSER